MPGIKTWEHTGWPPRVLDRWPVRVTSSGIGTSPPLSTRDVQLTPDEQAAAVARRAALQAKYEIVDGPHGVRAVPRRIDVVQDMFEG